MSEPVIQATNVSRTFGARYILRNINLTVTPGEAVCLLGDNGAGKTTLLRMLATLLSPTSGEIVLFNDKDEENRTELRKRIGVLFSETHLYFDLSVLENLTFYARLHHIEQAPSEISNWLKCFQMSEHTESLVRTLSRGERQRIGLIRSLLHKPELVLWDEPTTGLDENGKKLITSIARELKGETTFVFSTHEPDALSAWTDRTLRIQNGRIA